MPVGTHRRRQFCALIVLVWMISMGVPPAQEAGPSPPVEESKSSEDPNRKTEGPVPSTESTLPVVPPNTGSYSAQGVGVQVERITIDPNAPQGDLEGVLNQLCTEVSNLKNKMNRDDPSFGIAERIERVCGNRTKFEKYEPGTPVSFYAPGLCGAVEAGRDSILKHVGADLNSKVMNICGFGTLRSGVPGLSGLGLNVVNGFSDFLKERAEEELVVYAVDRIGRRLCGKNPEMTCPVPERGSGACSPAFNPQVDGNGAEATWSRKRDELHFRELFPEACCTVFPDGIDAEMDFDALSSGGATKALREDIQYIPARVVQHIAGAGNEQEAWARILESLVLEARELSRGESPLDFLARVAERLDEARAGKCMQIKCDLRKRDGITPSCVSLLLIEVGREGADRFRKSAEVNLSIWLDNALGTFCKNYGNPSEDATCVIDKNLDPNLDPNSVLDYLKHWHPGLKKFAESFKRIAEVQAAIDAARKQGSFQSEIARRSLPDVAASLDATIQVLADILEANKVAGERVSFIRAASRGIAALLADDVPGLQQALVELVEAAPDGSLSPALKRTLKFTASLAAAKDRGEVNTIITEAALPLRSYRAKYASKPDRLWTINAYVGYLFASQRNGRRDEDTVSSSEYATSLSAPVGIDVTLGHSGRGRHHFGAMASLIDPLAMTTETSGEGGVEASWRSVLAPGLFARWGVARSPVSVLLGGVYRPGLESSETCGSDPCWRGATQVGLSVAVDIPLMVVH